MEMNGGPSLLAFTVFTLLSGTFVSFAQPADRVFAFTPNQIIEKDYSDVNQFVLGGDALRIIVIVHPYSFASNMMVTPRTLNLQSGRNDKPEDSTVQIKLYVPPSIQSKDVQLTAFKLNGHPISTTNNLSVQNVLAPQSYKLSSDFVHLYFDRSNVIDILGPVTGDRMVVLSANINRSNVITAVDVIKLLPSR